MGFTILAFGSLAFVFFSLTRTTEADDGHVEDPHLTASS
jgi:hypothetical protein